MNDYKEKRMTDKEIGQQFQTPDAVAPPPGHPTTTAAWDHCGIEEKLARLRNVLRDIRSRSDHHA
mgnify:CR=1 FL=1